MPDYLLVLIAVFGKHSVYSNDARIAASVSR